LTFAVRTSGWVCCECQIHSTGAPAALRVKIINTQVSHYGHAGSIRHSPRNGFNGLFHALPGDRAFCHRHQRDAKCIVADLTPASRRQDHMASPSATCALVWSACCVHRIFRPTFSDDRETPLMRAEDAQECAADLGERSTARALRPIGTTGKSVDAPKRVSRSQCRGISSALPLPLWERVGERGSNSLPETSLRFVSDLSHKGRGDKLNPA